MSVMSKHQKRILSAIPTCTSPTKFEKFMPMIEDGKEEQWELEEDDGNKINGTHERMIKIVEENPDAKTLVQKADAGEVLEEELDFVAWVRETLAKIDFECGLTDNCVNLLKIALERGYDELVRDLATWEHYDQYTRICTSVSESINSFMDSSVTSFTDRFARLLDQELIKNALPIVGLIEWKVSTTESEESIDKRVREAVLALMKQTNEQTTKVLVAFRKARPDVVDDHIILEVLLNMSTTGGDLMKSLADLPVDKYVNVTSSLGSLMSRGVKMTFKSIFESMKEP